MLKQITLLSLLSGVHIILAVAAPAPADSGSTGTSGPLAGTDGKPQCAYLKSNTRADWLVTALCAISKCNKNWPLSNIVITSGDLSNAAEAKFTTYDSSLNPITTTVKYADATKDQSDNVGASWFGGGFDRAIEKMGGDGVTRDGALIKNDDSNQDALEEDGIWGLSYLTGQIAVREDIPQDDVTFVNWMWKVDGSPVLIRTNSAPDASLTANQYYTVSRYNGTANTVKLWDPIGDGDAAYKVIATGTLKKSCKYLYHLDWPHFIGK